MDGRQQWHWYTASISSLGPWQMTEQHEVLPFATPIPNQSRITLTHGLWWALLRYCRARFPAQMNIAPFQGPSTAGLNQKVEAGLGSNHERSTSRMYLERQNITTKLRRALSTGVTIAQRNTTHKLCADIVTSTLEISIYYHAVVDLHTSVAVEGQTFGESYPPTHKIVLNNT